MNNKVVFYIVLILFILSLVLSLGISYARYVLSVESSPITITTRSYSDLIINSVTAEEGETSAYNISFSNPNNCTVNFVVEGYNQNDESQPVNVLMFGNTRGIVSDYSIGRNGNNTFKIKVEPKTEITNYVTSQVGDDIIIPVVLNAKVTSPYHAHDVIQSGIASIKLDEIKYYDIIFNGNGNTGGTTANQTHVVSNSDIVLNTNGFTRSFSVSFEEGNADPVDDENVQSTFEGWKLNNEGDIILDGATVNGLVSEGEANLYAVWTDNSIVLPNPSWIYRCNGWYLEPECYNKVGNPGDLYTPTEDVVLYAHYATPK